MSALRICCWSESRRAAAAHGDELLVRAHSGAVDEIRDGRVGGEGGRRLAGEQGDKNGNGSDCRLKKSDHKVTIQYYNILKQLF